MDVMFFGISKGGSMKYGLAICSLLVAMSLTACGSDDDDDMFGMKQMIDEFEDMADGSSNGLDKSSGSKSKSSSSSANAYSSEEEPAEVASRTFIEFHYDSTRKATIATRKFHDALINYDYRTVQVGLQVWLGENVRRSAKTAKCYEDKESYCETYSSLYASTSGLCPADFNVPTVEDWNQLLKVAGGANVLMSKNLWENSKGEAILGKDAVGFSMLPGGICIGDKCSGIHTEANFFAQKGDTRGYVTFKPGKDSLEWHAINEKDSVRVSLRCVQPATEVQKLSEIDSLCIPSKTFEVAEKGYMYECTNDSVWAEVRDTLPKSCSSSENGKRYRKQSADFICNGGKIDTIPYIARLNGLCTEKNEKDTIVFASKVYVCESYEWTRKTIEDLYGECSGSSHRVVSYTGVDYRCKNGKWDTLTVVEKARGFCNEQMEGDTALVEGIYNTILLGGTVETGLFELPAPHPYYYNFVCKNSEWVACSTYEDYFGKCTSARRGEVGSYITGYTSSPTTYTFICADTGWREPNKTEKRQGFCTKDLENKLVKDSVYYYICKNGFWTEPSLDEFPVSCDKAHLDSVYKTLNHTFVCDVDTLKWREMDYQELKLGLCNEEKEGQTGRPSNSLASYYLCKNRKWVRTDSLNYFLGFCSTGSENYQKVKTHRDKKDYYCNGEKWVVATMADVLGQCTSANVKDTARYRDTLYFCSVTGKWVVATFGSYFGGCSTHDAGPVVYDFFDNVNRICENYSWRTATMDDIESCDASRYGEIKKMPEGDNRNFVCVNKYYRSYERYATWRLMTKEDSTMGVCSPATEGKIGEMPNSSLKYVCVVPKDLNNASYWDWASKPEALGACTSANEGQKVVYATQTTVCSGGKWTVQYGTLDIKGVAHKTVQFAGLTFLAENVKVPTQNSKCYKGNNNEDCTHGRLYQFVEAYEICPTGWHMMDTTEFNTIAKTAKTYSGHLYSVNIFDASPSAWQGSSGNSLDDAYGINIYGVGYCDTNGNCENSMRDSYLWTMDVVDLDHSMTIHHTYQRTQEYVSMHIDSYLGARCVKDH